MLAVGSNYQNQQQHLTVKNISVLCAQRYLSLIVISYFN